MSLEEISSGVLIEVLGIIITLVIVDRLIYKYEKKKWSELDKRIKERLVNFLIYIYNITFLHIGRMREWAEINRSAKSKEDKIVEYVKLLETPKINEEYLETVIKDSYLNKWYSDAYDGIHKQNETLFQDFHTRFDHNQLPVILDLKTVLSSLSTNLKLYHNLAELVKSEKIAVTLDSSNRIKEDLLKIILLITKLSKTIETNKSKIMKSKIVLS